MDNMKELIKKSKFYKNIIGLIRILVLSMSLSFLVVLSISYDEITHATIIGFTIFILAIYFIAFIFELLLKRITNKLDEIQKQNEFLEFLERSNKDE